MGSVVISTTTACTVAGVALRVPQAKSVSVGIVQSAVPLGKSTVAVSVVIQLLIQTTAVGVGSPVRPVNSVAMASARSAVRRTKPIAQARAATY